MSGTIDYKLGLDAGGSVEQVGRVKKALTDTQTAASGVESAGKQMAKTLEDAADDIERDLAQSTSAAEKLEKALGPELVAALDRSGYGVQGLVGELRKAGITYEEIESEVVDLAGSINRLNQVGLAGVRTEVNSLDTDIGKVKDTTDRSHGVMANFTGDAIQELPVFTGLLGPLNTAIGQTAEYAAEGNINFKTMAALAGPMAGVGLVLGVISKHTEQVAKSKAFHTDRVEAFTKALQEGASAAEVWNAGLTGEEDKLEFVDAATGDIRDLTATLARNNVTWAEFSDHLDRGEASFEQWARTQFAFQDGANDLNHALQTGHQLIKDRTKAAQEAADQEFVFGRSIDQVAAAQQRAKNATQAYIDTVEAQAAQARAAATGLFDVERATIAAADSYDALIAQYVATVKVQKDSKASDAEKAAAVRDLREAELALFGEVTAIAEAFAREQGAADGSAAATAIQIEKLEEMKVKYPVLVEEIDAYIAKLKQIPTEIHTNATFGGGIGQFRQRFSAAGTAYHPGGPVEVGEHGREVVELPEGSRIHSAGDTARMLGGGDYIDQSVTHIYLPTQTPEAHAASIARYRRRNGLATV